MIPSSKAGWHLSLALLTVSFLLFVSFGLWVSEWLAVSQPRSAHALDTILSPQTIDTLYEDARLHHAILELTETVAKASLRYGNTLESDSLKDLGNSLSTEVARIKAAERSTPPRRQLLGRGDEGGGLLSGLSDLLQGKGNVSALSDTFQKGVHELADKVIGNAATPAYFLGIGLGMGLENGLNLTTLNESRAIAAKVVAASGEKSNGVTDLAEKLGTGLSAQLTPMLGKLNIPVGMLAFSLAQGVGQGTASGLNLTQEKFPPTNGTDVMAIVRNLGLGATGPIASSSAVQNLLSRAGTNGDFMAKIPRIAAAAGQGLGQGASRGLGLIKSDAAVVKQQAAVDPDHVDIPGTVGNLTQGLSQSFFESSNLSMLVSNSRTGFRFDSSTLLSLASGAGKGIGEGIAAGMGSDAGHNATALSSRAASDDGQQEEQIAEQFTKNLMTSLIQSGGAEAIGHSLSAQTGGLMGNIDVAKAAEGAARGLVEGSISALSEAGGLQKVIKGDFPKELATNLPSLPQTQFNDSLNGSIVAFARGLSGEGILLVSQLLNKGNKTSGSPPTKRSVDASAVATLSRRDDTASSAIDDESLHEIAQTGVETITCSGFGGLAAFALGVQKGPALKDKQGNAISPPLDNSTLAALPKGPVDVMHEGNKFTINLADQAVTINGRELKSFVALTVLHIVFSTLAFFFALPTYLALGAIWRLSDMIGHPINDAKMKKWRMIVLLGLFAPLAFLGIIFGIAGKGSAAHFRTAHSVFGLLALLVMIPALALSYMRLRTTVSIPPPSAFLFKNQLVAIKGPHKIHIIANMLIQQVLGLSLISWIEGFSDLRAISLCVVDAILTTNMLVGPLNLVLLVHIGTAGLLLARFILERRIALNRGAAHGNVTYNEKSDPMNTFTFGFKGSPPSPQAPPPAVTVRPPGPERRTAELYGREDSQIGWPMNTQKLGVPDSLPAAAPAHNRVASMDSTHYDDDRGDKYLEAQMYHASPPQGYSPHGFDGERRSLFPPLRPSRRKSSPFSGRASSELDPQIQLVAYAPPVPVYAHDLGGGSPGPTLNRFDGISRPVDNR